MAFYQHWVTRFLLRKDFFRRVKARLQAYDRKLRKDELDDLAFLLQDRPPGVIFDCGANVGFVTHRFRQLFPSAIVYAFEPNPPVFESLQHTYAADSNVKPFQVAISRAPGTIEFNQNTNSGTSSFYTPTAYNKRFYAREATKIAVEVTTIDAFAETQGLDTIDILKLDVEGSEHDALLGAERMLSRQAIDVIYSEVAIVPLYEGQPLLEDLAIMMRAKGYSLFNVYGFNESVARQAVLGNATFISQRLRESLAAKWGQDRCGW